MSLYPNLRMGVYPSIYPIVGAEVFIRRNSPGSEMRKEKVVKVGLKYFYTTNRSGLYDALQFRIGCPPGILDRKEGKYTIWNSETEFEDSRMVAKLRDLEHRISQELLRDNLDLKMVNYAYSLLTGENQ